MARLAWRACASLLVATAVLVATAATTPLESCIMAGDDEYLASSIAPRGPENRDALLVAGSANFGVFGDLLGAQPTIEIAALSSSVGASSHWPCSGLPLASALYSGGGREGCPCGWPGRLAYALRGRRGVHVTNHAKHGAGPGNFVSAFDEPAGPHVGVHFRDADVVVLEFAVPLRRRHTNWPHGHAALEVLIRRLLARRPAPPRIVLLNLPSAADDWLAMLRRANTTVAAAVVPPPSARSAESLATLLEGTARTRELARGYDVPMLSLPFLVNASRWGARLSRIPCFAASFGGTLAEPLDSPEMHPKLCVHALAAELVAARLLRETRSSELSRSSELPPVVFLDACRTPGTATANPVLHEVCLAALGNATTTLRFDTARHRDAALPSGASLRCASADQSSPDDDPPCVIAPRVGTDDRPEGLGLECRRDEASGQLITCLPTRTAAWAWTFDHRRQPGWITCGRASNATRVQPIAFELQCHSANPTLIVRHVRGYSAEWGRCLIEVRDAENEEVLLNSTIDAYRQRPQHTILEASLLPFRHARQQSESELARVRVTIQPLDEQRPPPKARGSKSAIPADPIDRQCANKFRLYELACY